jgi:hypothetical protein
LSERVADGERGAPGAEDDRAAGFHGDTMARERPGNSQDVGVESMRLARLELDDVGRAEKLDLGRKPIRQARDGLFMGDRAVPTDKEPEIASRGERAFQVRGRNVDPAVVELVAGLSRKAAEDQRRDRMTHRMADHRGKRNVG